MPSSLSPSKGNSTFYETHMFAPSCRQKVTFRSGLVQKKEKKEHLARCVASGAFQGFRSVSGTVHTVVKKKKKERFYRGGPPPARPEGLSGSRGSFYVKSQIQVVFPPSLARQTPGPVTRGQRPTFRDHNSLRLSSARKHRRPSAGPGWKVSGRQTTQISPVSEKDKSLSG